ncbi:MAG: ADP-ribosylglycohydrolase family protein, partial [Verrucomicrobia bacterium]|nr:ADP-ribosylglycohydrolase family protein [Verrucomicrobiota bacterium]
SLPVLSGLLDGEIESVRLVAREHLHLTHHHAVVERAADSLTRILGDVLLGKALQEAIVNHGNDFFSLRRAERWTHKPDAEVIDHHFSSACYIDKAFPASLYLAWKYAGRFKDGIIANTNIGGDNCHRGAVIGALLGADCGLKGIPVDWRRSLLMNRSLEQLPLFV